MHASLHSSAVQTKLENLPALVAAVWADDSNLQLEAMTKFRSLLIKGGPYIEQVIKAGVVPRFVEFLSRDDFVQLQHEAVWTLSNVAAGTSENTKLVIDHGAIPIFVKLLASQSDDVRLQAIWALANVALDSPKCRDLVLGHGALLSLLPQLNDHYAKVPMLRTATWALSVFCRGNPDPNPPFDLVKPALTALANLIHLNDEEVLTHSCWALSYISDATTTNDQIQVVIEAGVCRRLVELVMNQSPLVLEPALHTIGNIVTGDDAQTQKCIMDHQPLPCLLNLLENNFEESIKKVACQIISNITAGNQGQIQSVIAADIIAALVHLFKNAEFDIKKEVVWTISNVTAGGTRDQIKFLVSQGCIKPLCDLLDCNDLRILTVCLNALETILEVGEAGENLDSSEGVNPYAQMIYDAEGSEKIEDLQGHDNDKIFEKAVNMFETYFG